MNTDEHGLPEDGNGCSKRESAHPLGLQSKARRPGPKEVLQREEFERKRDIAQIPQQRHFENVQELSTRRVVNPFGPGFVIPHFPEETADERAQ